ncbi:MAG: HpcH/HpaI aldolase/citrate lyase family protein [Eubacteriales bacterium]
MIKNILKQKLINREPINGTHISMPVASHGEILGLAGFDFVWIDTEHAPMDDPTLLECINLTKMSGSSTVVRVPVDDYNKTKKVVEMGPDGIVFPMINTKELAQKAIASTLYPPYGNRGFGPMRAVRYGIDDVNEYINKGVFEMARLVQVETEEAVRNLEEILTVPYIDGFIIGPCDLAGSVGELGKKDQPKTRELIRHVGEVLSGAEKSFGVSIGNADEETLDFYLGIGANIISTGVDYGYLLNTAISTRERLNAFRKDFIEKHPV